MITVAMQLWIILFYEFSASEDAIDVDSFNSQFQSKQATPVKSGKSIGNSNQQP